MDGADNIVPLAGGNDDGVQCMRQIVCANAAVKSCVAAWLLALLLPDFQH